MSSPRATFSEAESLRSLPEIEREAILAELSEDQAEALLWSWDFWGRPNQKPPAGDWGIWLLLAGRGFGKTRTGAHWFHERAMATPHPMALIAKTPADARDYCIEGPGGLLRVIHPGERPVYEPSVRRLTWSNGSTATIYSAAEPEAIRGFSGATAWLDEFAKYPKPDLVWDNLQFGMRERSADRPRRLITTTTRPIPALKKIMKLPGATITRGSSYDNRANLDPSYYAETIAPYEGTRFGRQEIHGEMLEDAPGALFTLGMIDSNRTMAPPKMVRIVVAIDPSGAPDDEGENHDPIGIVAAGKGEDGKCYVLRDATLLAGPSTWARVATSTFDDLDADCIVAEGNYGGAMVEAVIRAARAKVPVRLVHATRGKAVRAEPVSLLLEKGQLKFVGGFAGLEDELIQFTRDGYIGGNSPNRADAMIWAVTELMFGTKGYGMLRVV